MSDLRTNEHERADDLEHKVAPNAGGAEHAGHEPSPGHDAAPADDSAQDAPLPQDAPVARAKRRVRSDWAEAFATPDPGTPHNEARDQAWAALLTILVDNAGSEEPEVLLDRADQALAAAKAAGGNAVHPLL